MTNAQWQQFQTYTNGFGEQDENGVDVSLLRENLKLTPIERLRRLQQAHEFFVKVSRARNHPV